MKERKETRQNLILFIHENFSLNEDMEDRESFSKTNSRNFSRNVYRKILLAPSIAKLTRFFRDNQLFVSKSTHVPTITSFPPFFQHRRLINTHFLPSKFYFS